MFTLTKRLYQLLALAALWVSLSACGGESLKVGLSFPDLENERWRKEEARLAVLLEEKGYEVLRQQANGDARLQADQVDNLVKEGVRAIIIVPVDGDALAGAVERAIAADVRVIAYDRLVKTPKLSAYLSFDNREAGRLQAQALLDALDIANRSGTARLVRLTGGPADPNNSLYRLGQDEALAPFITSRRVRLLADETITSREQVSAQRLLENTLKEQENRLDGVIVSGELLTLGTLEALKNAGLERDVLVAGQEASVVISNQIAGGAMAFAVFRDTRDLPPLTVRVLDRLLKEQPLLDLERCTLADLTGDAALDGTIFCALLPVKLLTPENLFDLVIVSGYQSYDDVYREIPDSLRPARP
jgi:D-xylose transport system substrate-binding protein